MSITIQPFNAPLRLFPELLKWHLNSLSFRTKHDLQCKSALYYFAVQIRIFKMMKKISDYITIDKEIQNGKPVFTGTRVPVQTLFWHLEKGISIEEFLQDFPSVTKEQATGVLEIANKIVNSAELEKFYETVD